MCDEEEDLSKELKGLQRTQVGEFLYRMSIPEVFCKYFIGRHSKTKDTIERDTWCHIQITRRGRMGCVSESVLQDSIIMQLKSLDILLHVWACCVGFRFQKSFI